jgi:AcrR family transcriptional regulator
MPKIVDHRRKREEILQAAARTFARHGYHGTNLQRVAAAAGMAKSSLYHYFPTREAVFAALVRQLMRHEVAVFRDLARGPGPPEERFAALLDALTGLFEEWAKAGPLLLDCIRDVQGRRALAQTFRAVRRALVRLIREGQRAGTFGGGNPAALATIVVGCLDGVLLEEILEPGGTQSGTVKQALRDALWRILGHDAAERHRRRA